MVIDAINRVLCQKDDFLQTLRANSATVVLQGDVLSPEVIDERLSKLQKELLKKVNQKDDYDAIADEILRLRDQRRQAEVDSVIKDEQMKKIRDLQDFVKSQPATITEFDETLVRRGCKDHRFRRSLHRRIQVRHYNQYRGLKQGSPYCRCWQCGSLGLSNDYFHVVALIVPRQCILAT